MKCFHLHKIVSLHHICHCPLKQTLKKELGNTSNRKCTTFERQLGSSSKETLDKYITEVAMISLDNKA